MVQSLKVGKYYTMPSADIYIKVRWCEKQLDGSYKLSVSILDKKTNYIYQKNVKATVQKQFIDSYIEYFPFN